MSPHLICLGRHFNFHFISRPDPEAGHKWDLGCQLRHIEWGAHFEALNKGVLMTPMNTLEKFFFISSVSEAQWSEMTSKIPFMASLWIRSGYDVTVEVSAQTYQVRAHIKALIKAVHAPSLKTLEIFFSFRESMMPSEWGLQFFKWRFTWRF